METLGSKSHLESRSIVELLEAIPTSVFPGSALWNIFFIPIAADTRIKIYKFILYSCSSHFDSLCSQGEVWTSHWTDNCVQNDWEILKTVESDEVHTYSGLYSIWPLSTIQQAPLPLKHFSPVCAIHGYISGTFQVTFSTGELLQITIFCDIQIHNVHCSLPIVKALSRFNSTEQTVWAAEKLSSWTTEQTNWAGEQVAGGTKQLTVDNCLDDNWAAQYVATEQLNRCQLSSWILDNSQLCSWTGGNPSADKAMTTEQMTTEQMTTEQMTTEQMTTEQVTTEQVTTEQVTTEQ